MLEHGRVDLPIRPDERERHVLELDTPFDVRRVELSRRILIVDRRLDVVGLEDSSSRHVAPQNERDNDRDQRQRCNDESKIGCECGHLPNGHAGTGQDLCPTHPQSKHDAELADACLHRCQESDPPCSLVRLGAHVVCGHVELVNLVLLANERLDNRHR